MVYWVNFVLGLTLHYSVTVKSVSRTGDYSLTTHNELNIGKKFNLKSVLRWLHHYLGLGQAEPETRKARKPEHFGPAHQPAGWRKFLARPELLCISGHGPEDFGKIKKKYFCEMLTSYFFGEKMEKLVQQSLA